MGYRKQKHICNSRLNSDNKDTHLRSIIIISSMKLLKCAEQASPWEVRHHQW